MNNPTYFNIHTHVFSRYCAPDKFLRVPLPKTLDPFAGFIKRFLEGGLSQKLIQLIARRSGSSLLERYIQFIQIGTQQSQNDVYGIMQNAYRSLKPDIRFVILTMNMDFMDPSHSYHLNINGQLKEIERLRLTYPNHVFPFLGIDPRHLQGQQLVNWAKDYFDRGICFGLKLYPSLGFFPFDPALDQLYEWAETNEIPIMTHCTRSGVFYTGRFSDVLTSSSPYRINSNSTSYVEIIERIKLFQDSKLTRKDTKYGCNIFTHPQNYIPILEKYPKLKICFGHFGGSDEMLGEKSKVMSQGLDQYNWHEFILNLIVNRPDFENVYTDISYTLSELKIFNKLKSYFETNAANKILFGTDFYMTAQENQEEAILRQSLDQLSNEQFRNIAAVNNNKYLQSTYYKLI